MAFYSWTCPNCNFNYAENNLPKYTCFCGRFSEPAYDPLNLPHSCAEYCDKLKNKDCKHNTCTVLCHPGACPPCNINVSTNCYCGKKTMLVPCQVAKRSRFSCGGICDSLLNCGKHRCEQPCHEGPCSTCSLPEEISCYCTKEVK